MADRFAEPPSFDEYVVARGGDLLRTAWLLMGDDRRAEDLVRTTLARSWPQWHHLSHVGAGSYDAELRRALVETYLRRRRARGSRSQQRAPASGRPPTRADLLGALAELAPRERVVLVLWTFDGLSDGQVAAALDDDVAVVQRLRVRAVDAVGDRLGLDEDGLRVALVGLPPQDPSVAGLLDQTRPYAARWRGVRGWALGAVAVVAVATVGGLLAGGGRDQVVPLPTPQPSRMTCRDSATPPSPPQLTTAPLSRTVSAVLVCAQTDEGSVWSGSLPPDAPVSVPIAVDALVLAPRTTGTECPKLPTGPAFRMVLLGTDGTVRTYANEGLACNGWPALASYYAALAEQGELGTGPGPTDGVFLGCPSVLGKSLAPPEVAPPSIPRGTVLVAATACLHPRAVATAIPRFRPVRANVLGGPQLAQLNADLARGGSRTRAASTCSTGASLFVIEAQMRNGRLLELSSPCGDVFSVDWQSRDNWAVSAQTRDMLRALLVAE
jgi:DNA-directed RNA polymerase specialized sigma24 family protein